MALTNSSWIKLSTNKATIGEKSNPPKGGTNLLKMSKYASVIILTNFTGCLSQSILGIQDIKIRRTIKIL